MTNDELELAIEYVDVMIQHPAHNKLSETTIRHLAFLISLAKEYLKIEGFPLEQSVNPNKMVNIWAEGFNKALRLCKLAAMKEKSRITEATQKVIDEIKQEIDRRPKYSNLGKIGCLKRVTELLELINGKEA